jgi:hypothetical protein
VRSLGQYQVHGVYGALVNVTGGENTWATHARYRASDLRKREAQLLRPRGLRPFRGTETMGVGRGTKAVDLRALQPWRAALVAHREFCNGVAAGCRMVGCLVLDTSLVKAILEAGKDEKTRQVEF